MNFPSTLFSSAVGATPNPVDKKKYFVPTPAPEPNPTPTPVPKPTTNPGTANTGLLDFTLQRTTISNANNGIGSPGYGYQMPGGAGSQTRTLPEKEKADDDVKQEPSKSNTAIFGIDTPTEKLIAGVVIVLILAVIGFGIYSFAKKR